VTAEASRKPCPTPDPGPAGTAREHLDSIRRGSCGIAAHAAVSALIAYAEHAEKQACESDRPAWSRNFGLLEAEFGIATNDDGSAALSAVRALKADRDQQAGYKSRAILAEHNVAALDAQLAAITAARQAGEVAGPDTWRPLFCEIAKEVALGSDPSGWRPAWVIRRVRDLVARLGECTCGSEPAPTPAPADTNSKFVVTGKCTRCMHGMSGCMREPPCAKPLPAPAPPTGDAAEVAKRGWPVGTRVKHAVHGVGVTNGAPRMCSGGDWGVGVDLPEGGYVVWYLSNCTLAPEPAAERDDPHGLGEGWELQSTDYYTHTTGAEVWLADGRWAWSRTAGGLCSCKYYVATAREAAALALGQPAATARREVDWEYAATMGQARWPDYAESPQPPSGLGWELVSSAAHSLPNENVMLVWSWKRLTTGTGGDHG
jgi:hypothetical protein